MMLVKFIMKIFQKFFKNDIKLNASEIALKENTNKYKTLDKAVGNLSDLNTTDKTNVVNAINEGVGKIIWENPNPENIFAGQTVILSEKIENFKYYTIIYRMANDNSICFSNTAVVGDGMRTSFQAASILNFRDTTSCEGTTCVFANCLAITTYGQDPAVNNSRAIPWKIIGHN